MVLSLHCLTLALQSVETLVTLQQLVWSNAVSNTAVQTSDLANFSGGYLNKSLRRKFSIFKKKDLLVRSEVGFTCNFFHHSYLWGVT